jgi:hypothetical protein
MRVCNPLTPKKIHAAVSIATGSQLADRLIDTNSDAAINT